MKRFTKALGVLAVLASIWGVSTAYAAGEKDKATDLFLKGDAQCTQCHDEGDAPKILLMGKTKHGTVADGRTPSCTNCHGESKSHIGGDANNRPKPDVTFTKKGGTPADVQAGQCLNCHKSDSTRTHWAGSTHESRDVSCANCHTLHAAKDKVLAKATQPEVCFACHKEQRAQVNRPSHHPVLEGKVSCSDCHNPHGTAGGVALLKRDNVRDTCFQCHAEKRGPFVHNHQPATEACTICHQPHGTVVESMLKVRPPFLCHECHTPHGGFIPQIIGSQVTGLRPGTVTGTPPPAAQQGLGKGTTNVSQGRACLNCHTEVHGSNNPSATNPTPQFMLR